MSQCTAVEMLEQVNEAIAKVLAGGQSYKIGSRQLTRANLPELRAMRADLQAQLASEEAGGLLDRTYVAFFEGR